LRGIAFEMDIRRTAIDGLLNPMVQGLAGRGVVGVVKRWRHGEAW
jgi:hypothetical protein